jgi:release factor glutamine methyltransferase
MKEFLSWSIGRLNQAGIDSPRMEAEVLFSGALKLCREEIYRRAERVLTEPEKAILCGFVERRVLREPVAYIIERKEFWSLDFKVTPDVLIPRPETETLVETLLLLVNSKNPDELPLRLLEIGTGSGAISVVAAQEIPGCRVTSTDYFLGALAVARLNAENHVVADKIDFVKSDIFLELPIVLYDCIVSNPPYIQTSHLNELMADVVDFEPRSALDGGNDGLSFYKRIIPKALSYLKEGGAIVLEIGETQAKAVTRLFYQEGQYEEIKVIQDYSGYDRVVSARKKIYG